MISFTIFGRLPNMNDYSDAQRRNKYAGAKMKRQAQDNVLAVILAQLGRKRVNGRVMIKYTFYEPNRKRDMDNVSAFAHKVIQDALVELGTIENDGWKHIAGMHDLYFVDKKNPRIEVELIEVNEQ